VSRGRQPPDSDGGRRLLPTGRWRLSWEAGVIQAKESPSMFFFFSNKLGWVGSILVSIVVSLILIALFAFVF
jgi:hypothetical protein